MFFKFLLAIVAALVLTAGFIIGSHWGIIWGLTTIIAGAIIIAAVIGYTYYNSYKKLRDMFIHY